MRLHRRLMTSLCMAAAAMAVAASTAFAAVPPSFGISFTPDGDPGQCSGPTQQWAPAPNWSSAIRLDTDGRRGGCQLAFGLHDVSGTFAGLLITYQWFVTPGGNAGQCGNQGQFTVPTNIGFGPNIRVDTDDSAGGCYLVFQVSGRDDVALDVQFWADGDPGQCGNALPQGQYWTASSGSTVTILDDTDGRLGGCDLAFRLRHM
ncbi:hypothetical protein [Kutzneria buriramensis]|uniref:Uncharacterized protein n=1 Tax=Kutzneria buriramensis TaxID=1045776 RepID=A0A3E0HHX5_9PSEU|nr:hypothetical protein [Kutzneria buriramensis]REH46047.1 hypothetical protein BCF44_107179 [Kutzneria buriramensis]